MGEHGCVVAYHPIAREIGSSILANGGNAFDAFVATAAAENVLAEGASTLAGALGVMTYRAADGVVSYLDADFAQPLSRDAIWTPEQQAPGRAVLVPGMPAGLQALATSHGRMSFSDLLQPAIQLAEGGFVVCNLMAATIADRAEILQSTDFARTTFFSDGAPLRPGDTLRFPVVGSFLRDLAREGSGHVYRGGFGARFLQEVAAQGGGLTEADLAAYQVRWCPPWTTTYRGHLLHSCSGRSYGGLWTLLALKTLEQRGERFGPHYSGDVAELAAMIGISREVWTESFLFDEMVEIDPGKVASYLSDDHASRIWQRVAAEVPSSGDAPHGAHSYAIITVDRDNNVASGTVTAASDPWGDGIFVDGLFLTASGRVPWNTAPGRRRLSPLSMHLVMQDERPRFAVGTISNSVVEASFQLLVNLIDYGLPPRKAVAVPRFGTFLPKRQLGQVVPNFEVNWLDPRVDRVIARDTGFRCRQRGLVDTGLGAVLALPQDGTAEGALLPLSYLAEPFAPDGRTLLEA